MFKFDKKTIEFLDLIKKSAKKQNIKVFFVGGMVRDNILKKPVKDIDLIIEGDAVDFILPSKIKIKSTSDFHTIKVEYKEKIYDIASTRLETYPHSGCLPEIKKIGIKLEDDVKRRDFTVNSLYCDLDFNIIDLVNGMDDIKNKTLRVLHNKSYIDDPTRILRGIDFKHRFDFNFSKNDEKLINNYLKNPDVNNSSQDRIIAVFKKVLKTKGVFEELIERKCHKLIKNIEIDFDKLNNAILKFDPDTKTKAQLYMDIIQNIEVEKINAKNEIEIYKNFKKIKNPIYYFYKTNDKNIFKYLKIKDIKLNIKGDDLINLGYKGEKIGKILDNFLLEKIKNKNFDEKNELKKLAHKK